MRTYTYISLSSMGAIKLFDSSVQRFQKFYWKKKSFILLKSNIIQMLLIRNVLRIFFNNLYFFFPACFVRLEVGNIKGSDP